MRETTSKKEDLYKELLYLIGSMQDSWNVSFSIQNIKDTIICLVNLQEIVPETILH